MYAAKNIQSTLYFPATVRANINLDLGPNARQPCPLALPAPFVPEGYVVDLQQQIRKCVIVA